MTDQNAPARVPIGEVLQDMTIVPLPEGHEAVTAYVLIKTRSSEVEDDGQYEWSWRSPEIVNQEELLGALVSQTDLLRRSILDQWEL